MEDDKGRWYRWTVTLWLHHIDGDLETLVNKDKAIQFFIAGKETCPTTGTLHWQAYIEFKYQVGKNRLKRLFGYNHKFIPSKGDADSNRVYTLKSCGDDFIEIGKAKKQGERTDLANMAHALLDGDKSMDQLVEECPEKIMQYRNGWRDLLARSLRKRVRTLGDPEIVTLDIDNEEDRLRWIRANEPDAYVIRDINEWGDYRGEETIIMLYHNAPNWVRIPIGMSLPSRYTNVYPGWTKVITFNDRSNKTYTINPIAGLCSEVCSDVHPVG